MDTSRLSQGQTIAAVGGLVLIISLFLDWTSGVTITIGVTSISTSGNAWDVFSGMDILMALVGLAAIAIAGATMTNASVDPPVKLDLVLALLGVGTIGWALGWDLENPNAGLGAWLGLLAAIAIAYGGFEAARAPQPVAATSTSPPPPPPPPPTESAGQAAPPGA
jgi:hypothetical protein